MNRTGIEGYREFLARRDGEADLLNRRLANRELFFHQLEANPVRSARPADRATFLRNLRRRKPEDGLDKKMLFLLATAKLNQADGMHPTPEGVDVIVKNILPSVEALVGALSGQRS